MDKFWKEFIILFVIYNLITILIFQAPGYAISYYAVDKDSGSTGYFIGSAIGLIITYILWIFFGKNYVMENNYA
jgi:hypothetical protein